MLVCTIYRYYNKLIISEGDSFALENPLELIVIVLLVSYDILNACIEVSIKAEQSLLFAKLLYNLVINQPNVRIDALVIEPAFWLQSQEGTAPQFVVQLLVCYYDFVLVRVRL